MTSKCLSVLTRSVSRPIHNRNPNVPDRGPPRGENSGSHRDYRDVLQGGTTHTSYGVSHGSMYPQALSSSSFQPGTPAGYDMAPHASQQPPTGPRPTSGPTELVRISGPSSQGSAGAWNSLTGSHFDQSTSESHSSYNRGDFRVIRLQNLRPIAAAPLSQGPAGVQNAWVPISQVYLNFTFLRRPLPEDNRTAMAPEKRKALVVCNGQTEYRTRVLIPMGVEDWDQLLPTSRSRLRVTTRY